jgi:hypothetical protein
MDTPDGYNYSVDQDECIIDHCRTGLGCQNLFLGVWLAGWTFGCVFLIRAGSVEINLVWSRAFFQQLGLG